MHRLHRFIVLLIIGVLGLQAGAFAMHAHLLPAAAGHDGHAMPLAQSRLSEPHAQHAAEHRQALASAHDGHHSLAQDGSDDHAGHHSAGCASAHSCFPIAHATAQAATAPVLLPALPQAAPRVAIPSSRPERLLRPPRLHG
jgi:hypothetical protein